MDPLAAANLEKNMRQPQRDTAKTERPTLNPRARAVGSVADRLSRPPRTARYDGQMLNVMVYMMYFLYGLPAATGAATGAATMTSASRRFGTGTATASGFTSSRRGR
jgi:hypothetical protein